MSNNILFVFEGKETESKISKSLQKHIFNNETEVIVECFFKADIYQLYAKLSTDDDLDTFTLLKERNANSLQDYTRNDFAEIYLFFDYDGHATKADDEKIIELLKMFDNETENGKLFISYPMVEALKHVNDSIKFDELTVCCNKNIHYKQQVGCECKPKYRYFSSYDMETLKYLIDLHLKKMNYIVEGEFTFPSDLILQDIIFQHQLEKFIKKDSTVSVVSAFPVFIHDYFGNKRTKELLNINNEDA